MAGAGEAATGRDPTVDPGALVRRDKVDASDQHSDENTWNWQIRLLILLAAGLILCCAGILTWPPQPLTLSDRVLDRYADRGSFFIFYISTPLASENRVYEDLRVKTSPEAQRLASDMVRAFKPVKGSRPGEVDHSDYVVGFQSDRDPVVFDVRVFDDSLEYQERNINRTSIVYRGGDVASFLDIVDEAEQIVRAHNSTAP